MYLTTNEIRRIWINRAQPGIETVRILADLNATSPGRMRTYIIGKGIATDEETRSREKPLPLPTIAHDEQEVCDCRVYYLPREILDAIVGWREINL